MNNQYYLPDYPWSIIKSYYAYFRQNKKDENGETYETFM